MNDSNSGPVESAISVIQELCQTYSDSIARGDRQRAEGTITEALNRGIAPKIVYLRILMQAQVELGERWHAGKLTIAEEHRATQLTLDMMARLRQVAPSRSPINKRIMITTIEGDSHLIGARLIADFFGLDGWNVDFLGTATPVAEIISFAREYKPEVIALSISQPEIIARLPGIIGELHALPHGPKILIGGNALRGSKETYGADGLALDPNNAISQARRMVGLTGTNASLSQYLSELGSRIHQNRKSLGMSQKDLGLSAGLDRAYISSVENGKQNITLAALMKISEALQIPFDELLVGKP